MAEWIAVNTCIDFALTIFVVLQLEWGTNTISKKLPLTMEVQKLKTLCHRLFEMDSSELTLFSYNSKVLRYKFIIRFLYIQMTFFIFRTRICMFLSIMIFVLYLFTRSKVAISLSSKTLENSLCLIVQLLYRWFKNR